MTTKRMQVAMRIAWFLAIALLVLLVQIKIVKQSQAEELLFTTQHLQGVASEEELEVYEYALRFTLNSLTWEDVRYFPEEIEPGLYRVDAGRLWKRGKTVRQILEFNILQTIVPPSV